AFVWKLVPGGVEPPTAGVVRGFATAPEDVSPAVRAEVRRLAAEYQFFHWHLEFPEVFTVSGAEDAEAGPQGWTGGFSCLLGNPPWEHTELKEQEFFAARDPDIAAAAGANRKRLIKSLAHDDPMLWRTFAHAKRQADGVSALCRLSGRFPLTGRGRINTYAIFAETFRSLVGPRGRSGVIVPTGIATDFTTQYFFCDLVECRSLAALYDFENAAPIFEGVHRSFKFSLLTVAGSAVPEPAAQFAFFLHDAALIESAAFSLTAEEILLLNPNTGTCPIFRTRRDAEITLGIYRQVPVLLKENDPEGNPWGISFMQGLFNMTSDSHLFHTREQLEVDGWTLCGNIFTRATDRMLPLYEAKMLHHYDHRWATYDGTDVRDVTLSEKQDPHFVVLPRYWVTQAEVAGKLSMRTKRSWLSSYRWVTNATNERTLVSALTPYGGAGNSQVLVLTECEPQLIMAAWASLCVDYVTRQKLGGQNMTFSTVQQVPVPRPVVFNAPVPWNRSDVVGAWIAPRVLELSFNAEDMRAFGEYLGDDGSPFRWDEERRTLLRAELDGAFFHLYDVDRDDIDYILDTFPIVRRKDEAKYGEFRTKRLILEVYDQMAEAIRTGEPYQTILDPPPGQGPRHPARTGTA
ncbi:MAG: Eco57I restriction-modification methylase domain-containing protein, partial [Candidatus Dormibacteria bacterium]